jgi:hypothetical protein
MLYRVTAPHFVAGFTTRRGVVVHAAPILRYMLRWTDRRAFKYIGRRGWSYHGYH